MARNRPRFGEIGRESGQKDETNTRNPKKALPGPEIGFLGVFFLHFSFFVGVGLFQDFAGSPKAFFPRFVRPYFSCVFSVFRFFVHLPYMPPGHGFLTRLRHAGAAFHGAGL